MAWENGRIRCGPCSQSLPVLPRARSGSVRSSAVGQANNDKQTGQSHLDALKPSGADRWIASPSLQTCTAVACEGSDGALYPIRNPREHDLAVPLRHFQWLSMSPENCPFRARPSGRVVPSTSFRFPGTRQIVPQNDRRPESGYLKAHTLRSLRSGSSLHPSIPQALDPSIPPILP